MRVYLDTSVVNGLYADEAPHIQAATVAFFHRLQRSAATFYGSDLLAAELERTPRAEKRAKLLQTLTAYHVELLPVTEEARQLAQRYVTAKIIPAR